ncbi:hypothetical protein OG589_29525 [Sphaerisporangium sp. NBC_01403]|uniref:hypothetical protein n=1 Tax=Sphaerisporangium sp. NBC_01403 TaxID=2903599 RepID=UPI0032457BDC
MGRGRRHKSSRDRESDPEWAGRQGGSGWQDDERGTQEWLADASGPAWLDPPTPPHTPSTPPEPARPDDAWNPGSPDPVRPDGWTAAPAPTEHLAGWDTGSQGVQQAAAGAVAEPEAWPQGEDAFPDAEPPRIRPERADTLLAPGPEKRGSRARTNRTNRTRFWRGRRLMALSAVAVVTAIGTVVIGVKLSSSQLELRRAPDCPSGQACAAIAPGKPPASTSPAPTESGTTPDPSGTESESPSASRSAKPSAGTSGTPDRRTPVASTRPTPDRKRTPTPRPSRTVRDTPEPVPSIEETDTASPDATPLADEGDPLISPGRVAVDFGVSEVTDTGYSGRLTVTNTGATLDGWSLRVPVGGIVTGADGAEWTQEGDTLVLSSAEALGRNEVAVISFVAEGDSTPPDGCELNGGTCRLQVADPPQVEPGR